MTLEERLHAAEQRRIQRGVDVTPSTPLIQPEPGACCGGTTSPEGFLDKLIATAKVIGELVHYTFDKKLDEDEQLKRMAICHQCTAVDSDGKKLFRYDALAQPRCGRSWDAQNNRDQSVDGCGCLLLVKVKGASQHCPLKEPKW